MNTAMQDGNDPERAGHLVQLVAKAMEVVIEILQGRLGASALIVSPPGLMYLERDFQRFVYLLMEVCKARRIELALCTPNLRVCAGDFVPTALFHHAYIAAISIVVQSFDCLDHVHLTLEDAIHYDLGMTMGRLTFHQRGHRIM